MTDMSLFVLSLWLFLGVYAGFRIWRAFFRRCNECSGRMRLDSLRDPAGVNFARYFSISFYNGVGRHIETYKCRQCGIEQAVKA